MASAPKLLTNYIKTTSTQFTFFVSTDWALYCHSLVSDGCHYLVLARELAIRPLNGVNYPFLVGPVFILVVEVG